MKNHPPQAGNTFLRVLQAQQISCRNIKNSFRPQKKKEEQSLFNNKGISFWALYLTFFQQLTFFQAVKIYKTMRAFKYWCSLLLIGPAHFKNTA